MADLSAGIVADDALMVDQGDRIPLDYKSGLSYTHSSKRVDLINNLASSGQQDQT